MNVLSTQWDACKRSNQTDLQRFRSLGLFPLWSNRILGREDVLLLCTAPRVPSGGPSPEREAPRTQWGSLHSSPGEQLARFCVSLSQKQTARWMSRLSDQTRIQPVKSCSFPLAVCCQFGIWWKNTIRTYSAYFLLNHSRYLVLAEPERRATWHRMRCRPTRWRRTRPSEGSRSCRSSSHRLWTYSPPLGHCETVWLCTPECARGLEL